MIRLEVDGRVFHVEFRHLRKLPERVNAKAITTCAIIAERPEEDRQAPGDDLLFTAIGNTVCDRRDNFSRHRGRLKAFANALDSCGALVGFKARLFEAYMVIDPDPRPSAPRFRPPKLPDEEKRARWEAGWEVRQKRAARRNLRRAIAGEAEKKEDRSQNTGA